MHQLKLIFACGLLVTLMRCGSLSGNEEKAAGTVQQEQAKQTGQNEHWEEKTKQMVESQIQSRGVSDKRVLTAMQETPRHRFVPESHRDFAFDDRPLPIGHGQTISQPYVVALMTEMLDLQGHEKVLEVGTGSGYQAAILSQLAREVYSIEVIETLAEPAKKRLARLGYNNVTVKWGDGYQGWPEHAPFDAIIVTAAPEEVPEALVDQLKEGGKMVLPVGDLVQRLKVLTKTADGRIQEKSEGGVRFVPMVHPDKEIPDK